MTALKLKSYVTITGKSPSTIAKDLKTTRQRVDHWLKNDSSVTYVEWDITEDRINKVWFEKVLWKRKIVQGRK